MLGYYTKRSQATADLKRHAHSVRQTVDAMDRKQRLRRSVSRVVERDKDGNPTRIAYDHPCLEPARRHRLAWSWK